MRLVDAPNKATYTAVQDAIQGDWWNRRGALANSFGAQTLHFLEPFPGIVENRRLKKYN